MDNGQSLNKSKTDQESAAPSTQGQPAINQPRVKSPALTQEPDSNPHNKWPQMGQQLLIKYWQLPWFLPPLPTQEQPEKKKKKFL
jgi:hypothetical protein